MFFFTNSDLNINNFNLKFNDKNFNIYTFLMEIAIHIYMYYFLLIYKFSRININTQLNTLEKGLK